MRPVVLSRTVQVPNYVTYFGVFDEIQPLNCFGRVYPSESHSCLHRL